MRSDYETERNCRGKNSVIVLWCVYAKGNVQSSPFEGPLCVGPTQETEKLQRQWKIGSPGQRSGQYHCGNRAIIMDLHNKASNISREERRRLGGNWKRVWVERKLIESLSRTINPRKALLIRLI